MKPRGHLIIILIFTFLLLSQLSATPLALAQSGDAWRAYPEISVVQALVAAGNEVWAATDGGVLRWNRTDGAYMWYTTADGLVSNQVQAIALDEAGRPWVGTPRGVSRFEGQAWTTYTSAEGLIDNDVHAIALDDAGQLWFGTAHGVSRFDGQSWTPYTGAAGLISDEVQTITGAEAGQIWFGTANGVSRFDGHTWRSYTTAEGLADNDVRAITIDAAGHVWFGTANGVSRFDGETWRAYTTEDGLLDNQIWAIEIDRAGHLWFATEGGVTEFGDQTWTVYTAAHGLAGEAARAIAIDRAGHLWFGTTQGRVSEFDRQGWITHAPLGQVTDIALDPAGNRWFGTWGDGVVRFDGQTWTTYTTADHLLSNYINAIAADENGQVWAATTKGVNHHDGQTWKSYTVENGPAHANVQAVAIDLEGRAWFGTAGGYWWGGGASVFDGETWTHYSSRDGLASDHIFSLAIDQKGRKWFGTDQGVSVFDDLAWTTYTTGDGLAHNWVNAIAVDPAGRLWFGTEGGGLSLFDGADWTTYTVVDGLASNIIYDITIDETDRVWVGTSGGVNVFDGATWRGYTPPAGLARPRVYALAIDQAGLKWLGFRQAGRGVSLFDESQWRVSRPPLPMVASEPSPAVPPASVEVAGPRLIDAGAGRVYARGVAAGVEKTVVLSLPDGRPLTTYDLVGELALDAERGWLYIDQGQAGLAGVDVETNSLVALIPLPAGQSSNPAPQLDPATGQLLLFRDNVVYWIEPETGHIMKTLPLGVTTVQFCDSLRADLWPVKETIREARYDHLQHILYAQFLTNPCFNESPSYTIVSYDVASGEPIGQAHGILSNAVLADGRLYYQQGSGDTEIQLTAWQAGEPWLTLSGWSEAGESLQLDPTRRRLYQLTSGGNLRVFDAQSMALSMHLTSPVQGQLVGHAPQTDQLYFLVENQLQTWPVEALQPPTPEPLLIAQPPAQAVDALLVSPNWTQDQTLFGLWDGGLLYISQDGGQTWGQARGGLPAPISALAVSPNYGNDQTLLAGVSGLGIFKSTDGGQLWQPSGAGLADMRVYEILLSPGFAQDQTALARVAGAGLYRSTNGGRAWQNLNSPVQQAVLSPEFATDRTLVGWSVGAFTTVRISRDGGDSWRLAGALPEGVPAQRLSLPPSFAQSQTLFAYGSDHNARGALYRAQADEELSHELALRGNFAIKQLIYTPGSEQNSPMFLLTRVNDRPEISLLEQEALYRSHDGGLTWQAFEPPAGVTPTALVASPNFAQDRTLFIGTTDGQVLRLEVPQELGSQE